MWNVKIGMLFGEVDETHVGGLEKNKHKDQKLNQGRGAFGKSAVIGAKERNTKQDNPYYAEISQPKC